MGFREIGCGFTAMSTLCKVMNMEPPMTVSTYTFQTINAKLHSAYAEAASKSIQKAAVETRQNVLKEEFSEGAVANCQVSVDGTWQRRGHASINGVVTVISKENGKVLDTAVLSKSCKGCQIWSHKKDEPGYQDWLANHQCQANHAKSSGSMEGAGAVQIFKRSIDKNKLRYTSYIEGWRYIILWRSRCRKSLW